MIQIYHYHSIGWFHCSEYNSKSRLSFSLDQTRSTIYPTLFKFHSVYSCNGSSCFIRDSVILWNIVHNSFKSGNIWWSYLINWKLQIHYEIIQFSLLFEHDQKVVWIVLLFQHNNLIIKCYSIQLNLQTISNIEPHS